MLYLRYGKVQPAGGAVGNSPTSTGLDSASDFDSDQDSGLIPQLDPKIPSRVGRICTYVAPANPLVPLLLLGLLHSKVKVLGSYRLRQQPSKLKVRRTYVPRIGG